MNNKFFILFFLILMNTAHIYCGKYARIQDYKDELNGSIAEIIQEKQLKDGALNYLKIEKNDKVYLIRVRERRLLLPESKLAMFNNKENQELDKAKMNP